MLNPITLLFLLLSTTPPIPADDFQQCLLRLEKIARQAGISQKTIDAGLKSAQFLPEVIKIDRHQPEFCSTFSHYLTCAVSDSRIATGTEMMKKHAPLLKKLKMKYGIPPHTLLSIWGLESNFGKNTGQLNILNSLPTLACDHRRSTFFTSELISALKLMDTHGFTKDGMTGSWAGAVGHTQLMPSSYFVYAVPAYRNGSPNLWQSIPDALASAANYLHQLGWKAGWKWGREITLPKTFDYRMTGLKTSKTLEDWHTLGLRDANGRKIPEYHIAGSVLAPGGHQNPTFIVYDNFHVILKWNRSIFYAISVGYLADRIKGRESLQKPISNEKKLAVAHIKALQNKLNSLGYSCGKVDGITGPATQQGIMAFQHSRNMIADGYPDVRVLKSLEISKNL